MEAIISVIKLFVTVMSSPLFWIFIAPFIFIKIFYPKLRGLAGEMLVKMKLCLLPKSKYIILNDIMIGNDYGTHQIDHIVISEYGIFVIETKNYYGLIVGDEFQNTWNQCLGRRKYKFNNPIHQNYGHIKTLESLLNIEENKFISIVCFSDDCKLKINSNSTVVNIKNLRRVIKNFYKALIETDIQQIANIILENNIKGRKNRKNHVKQIKLKLKEDQIKVDNMICPRCGSELVLKNGKYGTFKGCSRYPECRFMK